MKTLAGIAFIAILTITGVTVNAIGSVVTSDNTVTWESPCGDSEVLGHRVDGFGETKYVCAK